MSTATRQRATGSGTKISGLRVNAFAAVVMLIFEFGLGVDVNLYANLPASDKGKALFAAFGKAVTGGPTALTLHALLGTLLLVSAITVVVRAGMVHRAPLTTLAVVGLLAVVSAWISGSRFLGDQTNQGSLAMSIAGGVAIFCYVTILFMTPPASAVRRSR